ncbi:MAG: YidC/Oxa1 family membrane protein insertase, partial [Planctomycetaceae bacterium]
CLSHAVDLRLEPFLYFDDLSSPDNLAPLPFTIPYLGWTQFNLLPVIVWGLFMLQNKLFAPPPMNEEQAMQMKTMNVMMVFMLIMFYKVPSGLCLYFIVSSLWGIAEKLLLPKKKLAVAGDAGAISAPEPVVVKPRRESPAPTGEAKAPGFWELLMKAAEKPDPMERKSGPTDRKSRPRRDR